jgi:sterol desaturase/sphingolipid hydroxylase (fatty acid hydroxylase superfamily)
MNEIQLLSVGYVIFMLLIAGEAALSRWRADGRYRLGELVVNIGHGSVFQVADGFTKLLVLAPFVFLSEYALVELPITSAWGWLLGLLAYDFATYWRHRHHHRVHALWAVHGVHHAAEDFNFAAALRQALFQNVTGWIWMAPLALVMPMKMFIGLVVFDYLYQFVQHTQYVPKLGPIEWIFNTPSHHRVHHGRQEAYIDKNYGGILIIWDRMFGTFQEEFEEADFGITMPPNSLNPVWGNFILWGDLARASAQTPGVWNKLKLWLGPPEWTESLAGPLPHRVAQPLENEDIPEPRLRYAAMAFLSGMPVLGALPWVMDESWSVRILLGGIALLTAVTPGVLLEGRSWARRAEGLRLGLAFVAMVGLAMAGVAPVAVGALALALVGSTVGLGAAVLVPVPAVVESA